MQDDPGECHRRSGAPDPIQSVEEFNAGWRLRAVLQGEGRAVTRAIEARGGALSGGAALWINRRDHPLLLGRSSQPSPSRIPPSKS